MTHICITTLIHLAISTLLIASSQITVFPTTGTISGVFVVSRTAPNSKQQVYSFNASAARDVCQDLGASIATKAQVAQALTQGLETCRFGWVDEQIAIIPRLHPRPLCGQNKTGVIPWRSPLTNRFDVFCFNATDLELQLNITSTEPFTSSSSVHPLIRKSTLSAVSTSPLLGASIAPNSTFHPEEPGQAKSQTSTHSSRRVVMMALPVVFTMASVCLLAAVAYFGRMVVLPDW
ncbi:lymphatic vessel endothelial hyaluronic acid receptor 1a isoform X2 [Denticeps clupeoides]|uniref:lymphatic vessel endothelial hyaluronic acid receptor 1a isoform X2 n=1 Tax=Denticeps clupeoides TaxID=299321 RepID=UPI0010A50B51|nr:lymphatic vessel endothelial hyaluronic acid receptor 1 isoform X2 [Denticeps clupeoides]